MAHAPERYRAVSRVLLSVLFANLAVAVAKIAFGYFSGSVAITSDGYHSLTDSFSNIVGLVGLRVARKPPDLDHPYGHRKYETLTAAGIFVALILVVEEVVRHALTRLRGETTTVSVTTESFLVMLVTLAVNLLVVNYERRRGKALSSELLLADAMHTRSDVFTSLGVLASLVGVKLGYPILDPVGGLIVAVFIALTGFKIARESSRILSDRIVMDEDDVRKVVMAVPRVVGCHQIRSRGSADHVFLDLHVWVAPDMRLDDAHQISHVVKDSLMARYPEIADAIIHIEPPPKS